MNSQNTDPAPAVSAELERMGVVYRVFRHTGPLHSLEQAAAERSQQPDQVVRSLLFRLPDDQFLMVLVGGPRQVPWKALRRKLGISRMTMATDEELLSVTGAVPGSVSPFGLSRPVRILLDQHILQQPEISLGSGQRGVALLLSPPALLAALPEIEVIDIDEESA